MATKKNKLFTQLEQLCMLSECTFEVNTLDGKLTISVIADKGYYSGEDEYDIQKRVEIKKADGTLFSTLSYENYFSASSNGGAYFIQEIIDFPPDELHPEGYKAIYHHYSSYESTQAIKFNIDGRYYRIKPGVVFTGNQVFGSFIENNVLYARLDEKYSLGINIASGEMLIYLETGNFIKSKIIPAYSIDLLTKESIDGIKLTSLVGGEITPSTKEFEKQMVAKGVDLSTSIEEAKQAIRIYEQNKYLLQIYHKEETLAAIIESTRTRPLDDLSYGFLKGEVATHGPLISVPIKELNNDTRYGLNKCPIIAHSMGSVMQGYPESSIASLTALLETPLDLISGIEFDIRFAENGIVLMHDADTGDICDKKLIVGKSTVAELQSLDCGYHKSAYRSDIPWHDNKRFRIASLEDVLKMLMDYKSRLGDMIIKIDIKKAFLKPEELMMLNSLLYRYRALNDQITIITFGPWNLKGFRECQLATGDLLTRTEGLIDQKKVKWLIDIYDRYLDGVSLGLKTECLPIKKSKENAKQRNYDYFSRHRDAVTEASLEWAIKKYGYAGIYLISSLTDVEQLMANVSQEFIFENASNIEITTDSPYLVKTFPKCVLK